MNFNPYINILYYLSKLLNYLSSETANYSYKMKCLICNGVWNSQGAKPMYMRSWQYVNDVTQMSINKENYWLTLALLRLEVGSSQFCMEKWKQLEMVVSS